MLVTGDQLAAAIVNSLAWPVAFLVAVILLRPQIAGVFHRIQSVEFRGAKATFAALGDYEQAIAAAAKDEGSPAEQGIARQTKTEFGVLTAVAEAAPRQAIIDAWSRLEYQLNVASDQVAPDQPHGWPQVARNLESWPKWPMLYPVVAELRRLRDYTVRSNRTPSSSDAARYVLVVQDLVTTLRTSLAPSSESASESDPGGENERG